MKWIAHETLRLFWTVVFVGSVSLLAYGVWG